MFVDCFVESGYAFLSWDKPGLGKSTGVFYQQSLTTRAQEVLAAANRVMLRPDIDASRVSFVGLSQAGYVLPRVIKAFPKTRNLVLIGPGSWSFSEERAYQKQTQPKIVASVFSDQPGTDEIAMLLERLFSAPDSEFFDTWLEFHKEAKGKPWYQKFKAAFPPPPESADELNDCKLLFQQGLAFDAVQEYSGIPCRTLVLFGGNDECVNPTVGMENIRAGFRKSGNARLTFRVYPGASHTLKGAGDQPQKDIKDWLSGAD